MKIGFIGCGNMGGALAKAVCKRVDSATVSLSNRSPEKAKKLAEELGCIHSTNQIIASDCTWIFLGVKPHLMGGVLAEIAPILRQRTTEFVLVTMAAGLGTARIQEMAQGKYAVIRTMPNTPSAIGAGVLQYCGRDTTPEQLAIFADLLSDAGLVDYLPEELIDAASCVSGCGPAFAYLFIEALADGGVACGLPRDKAMLYAAKMLQGASQLVLETGEHPAKLKDQVCSPGGSTIQGVRALEEGGFRSAAIQAVLAAFEKNKELGKK